ncbi:MAG: CdaR family protein [Patescibacteria group bacterium]
MVNKKINPWLPLVALVPLAVLIWLTVFSLTYHSFTIDLPITITGLNNSLAVAEDLSAIKATIRSKNLTYYRLNRSTQVQAVLDLGYISSTGNYNVKPQIVLEANDVWLVEYDPETLPINIVPAERAQVEIIPDVQGFPLNGYALGDISIMPATVEIIGPGVLVSSLHQAYVPINVSGKHSSFVARGAPEVRDTTGNKLANVKFSPAEVEMSVQVVRGEMFKTVGIIPTFAGALPAGYWITEVTFDPPAATLRSSVSRLDGVNSISTTPINLAGKTGDFSDKVALEVPIGVSLVGINLVNVTVKIGASLYNRQMSLVPRYSDITPGFKVLSSSPTTVEVLLAGPPEKLNNLNRNDVVLKIDIRSATTGPNSVSLAPEMFQLPEDVQVLSFDPLTLEVNLTKTN